MIKIHKCALCDEARFQGGEFCEAHTAKKPAAKREIELFDGVQVGPFAKTPAIKIIIRTAALIRETRKEKASK